MKTLKMRKKHRKINRCTYKTTNILPAMCSSVSILVPTQCIDIILLFYGQIGEIFNVNINEF